MESSNDPSYCRICDIILTSRVVAEQHYRGTKHMKKARVQSVMGSTSSPRQSPPITQSVAPPIDEGTAQNEELKEYDFNPVTGQGMCYVCKVALTSPQLKEQHLLGRNHTRKASRWRLPVPSTHFDSTPRNPSPPQLEPPIEGREVSSEAWCSTCKVRFSGPECAAQHYASIRHLKKLTVGTNEDVLSNSIKCEICNIFVNTAEQLAIHQSGEKHQRKALLDGQPSTADLTNWYFCDVCSVKCNTADVLEKHKEGQAHLKRVGIASSGLNPQSQDNTLWHKCDECNVVCNSAEHLENHRQGAAHLKMIGSLPTGLDNTQWHKCHDCNVVCNSAEHLENHRQGAAHLKMIGSLPTGLDNTQWHKCHDYNVVCNSAEHLAIHQQGAGHMKRVGSLPTALENLATGILQQDNTYWLICDVCNVKCNSAEHLENHKLGIAHRKKERNLSIQIRTSSSTNVTERKTTSTGSSGNYGKTQGKDNAAFSMQQIRSSLQSASELQDGANEETAVKHMSFTDSAVEELSSKLSSSLQLSPSPNVAVSAGSTEHVTPDCEGGKSRYWLQNSLVPQAGESSASCSKNYPTYCAICQSPFSGNAPAKEHFESKRHKENVAKAQIAPERILPKVEKVKTCDNPYAVVETCPRSYQVELFEKTLANDTIVFLPTGMGKTLVSTMTICCMLRGNPARPVLFLVDRVLLVIQQSQAIQKEIGEMDFKRTDKDGHIVERKLHIAALCSGVKYSSDLPLYEQDIIVVTAGYFLNLVSNKLLRWKDFCLVVYDEAHHCTKEHPFNKALKDLHKPLNPDERPRILGLTASPAGQPTVMKTEKMMLELLDNIGHGQMAIVEDCLREFATYKSQTKPEIKLIPLDQEEQKLQDDLEDYLVECFLAVDRETNIAYYNPDLNRNASTEKGLKAAKSLELIEGILECFKVMENSVVPLDNSPDRKEQVEHLISHTKVILDGFYSLRNVGIYECIEHLKQLLLPDARNGFSFASWEGLNSDALKSVMSSLTGESSSSLDKMSNILSEVKEQILTVKWDEREHGQKPLVLVLVRQRQTAKKVAEILKNSEELSAKGLQSVFLVGHGGGSDGLTVTQQKNVLGEIRKYTYQIIVATSVAEEGLDLPACELVIQLDPPSNVTALVQIRGRARKKNSRFVAICHEQKQMDTIKDLLMREENMIEAAKNIVKRQKAAVNVRMNTD